MCMYAICRRFLILTSSLYLPNWHLNVMQWERSIPICMHSFFGWMIVQVDFLKTIIQLLNWIWASQKTQQKFLFPIGNVVKRFNFFISTPTEKLAATWLVFIGRNSIYTHNIPKLIHLPWITLFFTHSWIRLPRKN